jgi:hypothetical protein
MALGVAMLNAMVDTWSWGCCSDPSSGSTEGIWSSRPEHCLAVTMGVWRDPPHGTLATRVETLLGAVGRRECGLLDRVIARARRDGGCARPGCYLRAATGSPSSSGWPHLVVQNLFPL